MVFTRCGVCDPPSLGVARASFSRCRDCIPLFSTRGDPHNGEGERPAGEWLRSYSEKDAKLAQKLGQLQPFIAVFRQEFMGRLVFMGQPNNFHAYLGVWDLRGIAAHEQLAGRAEPGRGG